MKSAVRCELRRGGAVSLYGHFRGKTVDDRLLAGRVGVLEDDRLLVAGLDRLLGARQQTQDLDDADEKLFAGSRTCAEHRDFDARRAVSQHGREDGRHGGLPRAAVGRQEHLLAQLLGLEALLDLRQTAVKVVAVDGAQRRFEHRTERVALHRRQLVVLVGLEVLHAPVDLAQDGIAARLGAQLALRQERREQRAVGVLRVEEALSLAAVRIVDRRAQPLRAQHRLGHRFRAASAVR